VSFFRSKTGDLVEAHQFSGGFGTAPIVNHRGGSYGLVVGDWLIRLRGGELTHCRGDRFAQEYEAVDG
jgi:hypothetical protein